MNITSIIAVLHVLPQRDVCPFQEKLIPIKTEAVAAAEALTCLSRAFGDASCLLEEVGDCWLPDF